ncbi:MAG: hydrogenase maturation protease [Syntrophales bacterium]|nr:hydrogenase maturation protease [Syntrophales bacterium]
MARQIFGKSALVFGCGNILFGDDGFGPAVVNYLQENHPLPADVMVMDVGTSIRDLLFDLMLSERKPQKIIIIDAVDFPDHQPGEVFEIPVDAIPPKKTADFSLHQFPTVNMLQELQEHTRVEIHIVVAQVKEVPEEVKPGLTPVVEGAIKVAAARILSILGVC